MTQLLVERKMPLRGNIVQVMTGSHVWGRREHKEVWRNEFGNVDDYPADFIVVRIPDMPIEEAQRLRRMVRTSTNTGPIDPETGLPSEVHTIHHNSKASIDFAGMADTPARQVRLGQYGIVVRQWAAAHPYITERSAP